MKKMKLLLVVCSLLCFSLLILNGCSDQYVIKFDSNGGSKIATINQKGGTLLNMPNAPIKEGNTFLGWYTDKNFDTPFISDLMPSQNLTLYAKWLVNDYKIKIQNFYDMTSLADNYYYPNTLTFAYGTTINLPTVPNGYYYDLECSRLFSLTKMPAEDLIIYRKW